VVFLRKSIPQNHNLKTAAELGVEVCRSYVPKVRFETGQSKIAKTVLATR
jgi:hypothetical protein